jgi:Fe-coproporphyrin III synthase
VIQVHPSRHCNLACEHCYTSSGPKVRGELSIEMLRGVLEDAAALGYRQLAVSGGEPLLYSSLRDLLAAARLHGMLATLTTNGMLVTRERWSELAPLVDLVAVSIDGVEADHDRIRGQPGAFARTIANLPVIRASGVAFGFIFTLTQHNADSLERLVELAAAHGARSVQVHPLTLHGRARELMPGERPDELELLAAIVEAQRLGESCGVVVHVDALTIDQVTAYRDRLVPARPVRIPTALSPVMVVEASGTVMPLTHELARGFRIGNLHDARLAKLVGNWLASGRADKLAQVCERTWHELASTRAAHACYWYDEVALRSHELARAWINATEAAPARAREP